MVGTIPRMAYVLLVLLDRYRQLAHRHAHPVVKVTTPAKLEVTANSVITIISRTQLEHLHARNVPKKWYLTYSLKGRLAEPVCQGSI